MQESADRGCGSGSMQESADGVADPAPFFSDLGPVFLKKRIRSLSEDPDLIIFF